MSKQGTGKRVGGDGRASGVRSDAPVEPQMADRAAAAGGKTSRPASVPEKRAGTSSNSNTSVGARSRGGAQARPRAQHAVAPKGSSVRPLDLALVALGLVVVGLIVWSSLGSNSSQNTQQVPSLPTTAARVNTTPSGPNPTPDPSNPVVLGVGRVAPDFSLPSPDGTAYSLSQFKGKVVLLEFFAPWCPHCQEDAPMFNEVHEKYKDKGVQVLAISASPWGRNMEEERKAKKDPTPISMDDIRWFRDTYKVAFPMLFDKDVVNAEKYAILYYPTVYIVDKEGKIAAQPAGKYVFENNEPVPQREEPLSVDFLSRELDKVLGK